MVDRRTINKLNKVSEFIERLDANPNNGVFEIGLTVSGDSTYTGDITQTGDYTIVGAITQTGDYTITGDITQTGDLTLTGDATVSGDYTVNGDITIAGRTKINNTGADGNDGLLIIRNDDSTGTGDLLGGIGFDSDDGNVPSSITEASAYIASYAAENHSATTKGGYLVLGTTAIDDDDDTTSHERMRIDSEGTISIGTSDGAGKHIISVDVDLRYAHSSDNTVITEVPNISIPGKSIINRVAAIVKTVSNINVLNVFITLSATSGHSVDLTVPAGFGEILGAGESDTDSTDSSSASDISVGGTAGDIKDVWYSNAIQRIGTSDQYIYVANAGTSNGTTNPTAGTLQIIIEYYGMD